MVGSAVSNARFVQPRMDHVLLILPWRLHPRGAVQVIVYLQSFFHPPKSRRKSASGYGAIVLTEGTARSSESVRTIQRRKTTGTKSSDICMADLGYTRSDDPRLEHRGGVHDSEPQLLSRSNQS